MADDTPRASEQGHFYKRDGTPVYEVPRADGKGTCPPDIRHARKYSLLPGATTIIACAEKPALTVWKVNQGILSSMTLPRRPHEPDVEFIKRVVEDSQEQAKTAAEKGTAIHTAIKSYYEGRPFTDEYADYVLGASTEIQKMFGGAGWACETSFGSPLGYGGKIDLDRESERILGDIKGKDFDEPPMPSNRVKLHWDENVMQLAAYKMGKYGSLDGPAFNVYVSRTVPGLAHIHVWEREDLERGWKMFAALLLFWKARQKYESGWQP